MPKFSVGTFRDVASSVAPGALGGALVGLTRVNPDPAWLQIPALAIFLWSLSRETKTAGRLLPGFFFGAALAGVALSGIRVAAFEALTLSIGLTAYWCALGFGMSFPLRRGGVAGIFGAAGIFAIGEWIQPQAMPIFGTAQRIASVWVNEPLAHPLSWLGGTTLISFALPLISFVPVVFLARSGNRRRKIFSVLGLAVFGAALYAANVAINTNGASGNIAVAACGAPPGEGAFLPEKLFWETYGPAVSEAANQGAKVVVTPELGLSVSPETRDATLGALAEKAKSLGIAWCVGFSEGKRADPTAHNRAVILNADKPVGDIYDKTHWVHSMETYARHGDGRAVTAPLPDAGVKLGVMICQDDNYEDVARNLSLAGVNLALTPTFDWPGVERGHLDSARNRPREFGFVSVRAAIGGVSAVIGTDGEVLAQHDHVAGKDYGFALGSFLFEHGHGGSPTPFAEFGDWPTLLASVICVVGAFAQRPARV